MLGICGCLFLLLLQFFKVDGRHLTQAGVAPPWVVPSLDPGEYLHPGARLGFPLAPSDELALQRGKEALGHGVVIRVTDRTHGWAHVHLLAPITKRNAGVLGALVGMMDHILGFSGEQRHIQRCNHQI